MKVLFLSHQANYLYGGEICTLAFMRELHSRGMDVHFASPLGPYHEQAKAFATCHEIPSIQFSRKFHILPKLFPALLQTHRVLRKIVKREKIQIVHATSLKSMVYAWLLARYMPVIWHHHDILPLRFQNNLWVQILAQAAQILTPSKAACRGLVRAGVDERKVHVLHNGFRVDEWQIRSPKKEGEPFVIAMIGEISHRKGVDLLPAVLDELYKRGRWKFRMLLIGEGLSDPSFAEMMKTKLAVYPEVKFLGRREDVKAQLQEIDLLLVLSREDPLPTVIIEAGLSGVPVIGTKVGGIPEMIESGENGFFAAHPEEFADAIEVVRTSLPTFSQNARKFAEMNYNVSALTTDLLRVYERVLGAKQ